MSSSIENRVVDMTFRNEQFERGAATSMSTLDRLKGKLNFDGSRKSAEELQGAVSKFSMSGMTSQIAGAAQGLSAMGVVGVTALATLTTKAVSAGASIAKSLTVGPALEGLREYETNLNSIQTVLANTSSKGTTLEDVNGALEELNHYSDKTIYNFSEMAKNIGTFTAAGVDLDASTSAIKGIANLAALSGSNSEQASTAMYQLSQAMSTGKVSLMDWNSVVNAGMGGQVFQDALVQTAKVQGVAVDDIIKKNGSFRDSLQDGWLTAEVLQKTLAQFTGDMSAEQLKTMGYTEKQIAEIIKLGQTATDAATKVKTFSQLMGTLREAMGSGWSKSFQILLGDFDEAKAFFTSINDVIGGSIGAGADARNALLQGWSDLGGRQVLIEAFWNVLNSGLLIISHIKVAFRDIFPARNAQQLVDLTARFRDFTKRIAEGAVNFGPFIRILRGFIAAISIGVNFVKALAGALFDLLGSLSGGGNALYEFVGGIADWLVNMDKAIKKGDLFTKFFDQLGGIIRTAIGFIKEFIAGTLDFEKVKAMFASIGAAVKTMFSGLREQIAPIGGFLDTVLTKIQEFGAGISNFLGPAAEEIKKQLKQVKDAIFGGLSTEGFDSLGEVLATGFLGGLTFAIRKLIKDGLSFDLTGGLFENINDSLEGLTGTLTSMQTNLKADTLLKIAAAVGILALSIVALSNIEPDKLVKAMTGLAVGMAQLVAAMAVLNLIGTGGGFIKLPFIAAGMILLAGALLLLSAAVKNMSEMSWDEIGRGMAGIAGGLTLLTAAMTVLGGISGGILRASFAMIPMAKGLNLLAGAVKQFAGMDWNTMARGLTGAGVGLGLITLSLRNMPPNIRANALGLVIIAGALKLLSMAVSSFGAISWDTMARGMTGVAVSLGIITTALRLMPKNIMAQSTALIAVGLALNILAKALASMGGMSWEEIGKGMVVLAGSLGILAIALRVMTGTGGAALALTAVALALMLFVPVMFALGSMPWPVILTALVALAAVFAVIGVAGLLLTPVIPAILGLALAMGIFGAGVVLFGVGALAAATAIGILVAAGATGIALLITAIGAIVAQIPTFLKAVAEGIIGMVKVIGDNAPIIIDSMVKIAIGILDAVIDLAPKAGEAMSTVISTLLDVIVENIPNIVQAGMDLLNGLLQGIADNIGEVVTTTTKIITEFLGALEKSIPEILQAGADLLVAVVDGMANAVKDNAPRLTTAGLNLVDAIVDGFINGLASLAGYVKQKAMDFFSGIWNGVKEFFGVASPSKQFHWLGKMLMVGLGNGIDAEGNRAVDAAANMSGNVMDKVSESISTLPSLFGDITDIRPTITPVLNLASVQSEARKLNGLLVPPTIDPMVAFGQAQAISRSQAELTADAAVAPDPAPSISFQQTIHSPKPLSTIDIYRDSRSLLASAKKELSIP